MYIVAQITHANDFKTMDSGHQANFGKTVCFPKLGFAISCRKLSIKYKQINPVRAWSLVLGWAEWSLATPSVPCELWEADGSSPAIHRPTRFGASASPKPRLRSLGTSVVLPRVTEPLNGDTKIPFETLFLRGKLGPGKYPTLRIGRRTYRSDDKNGWIKL